MKFGTGSTTELTQKPEGQSTKMPYVRPYIYTNKLVVRSNSASAWRASRLFLQKNRTEKLHLTVVHSVTLSILS